MRSTIVFFLLVRLGLECAFADDTWAYAVQLSATTRTSPPQITLSWPQDPYGVRTYTVYRKAKEATSWGTGTALSGGTTTYADNNVVAGGAYEYQVVKDATLGYIGYGYIYAGIEVPLVDNRGKVVLVVDSSQAGALTNELYRLQQDLAGDGWTVIRLDVSPTDTPVNVRSMIQTAYRADAANVKAVFLFGHVPILRCGNLDVDIHTPRPMPADGFYGEMDAVWNNPDYIPSDIDLMVGRVDLSNMPVATASETQLLRNYLNKDHNWRYKQIIVPRRGLIGNRTGDKQGEAPAASGFRNFEPLVGPGNIVMANEQEGAPDSQRWISMLTAASYVWTYASGGGSYTSLSFMGTHGQYDEVWSLDIVTMDPKAVFFMMYGSWLGEWDTTDNIMRSTLATATMGLTCSYAGRPHWFYHHMGLGEPIGYSARLTQNNATLYRNVTNQFTRGVHIALMGDPTLRMHPIAPATAVRTTPGATAVQVNWTRSTDTVLGYHVYRAASPLGPYSRRTTSLVTSNSFADSNGTAGTYTYMVRAVNLEVTPSGTYYNASQGAFSPATTVGGGIVRPRIAISASGSPKVLQLRWNSTTGVPYKVQYNTNLGSTQWNNLTTVTGSNTTTTWSQTMPGDLRRFYRIVIE